MKVMEPGTSKTAKALIAIWMLLAVWLLLRAVIVETAIQSSGLSTYARIVEEDPTVASSEIAYRLARLRAAPLGELRLALIQLLALALGFYLSLRGAQLLDTRPWGRRLARPLVLVGAVTVAIFLLASKTPPRPPRRVLDATPSIERPSLPDRIGPSLTILDLEGQPSLTP